MMNEMKRIAILLGAAILTYACDYAMMVQTPDFKVVTPVIEINTGEAATFRFEGNADYITFYSGEAYSDYKFRDGRKIIPGDRNTLSFETAISEVGQRDQLSVLIGNDFNGDYLDYNNLINSGWTDITSNITLATDANVKNSSDIDISSFIQDDKPTYIAFRYKTKSQAENGKASRWVVSNLKVKTYPEELGECTMCEIATAGFRIVDPFSRTSAACRTSLSQTQLVMQGNFYGLDSDGVMQGEDLENEHWVISRALDMKSEKDMGPDRPVSVKGYTQPMTETYEHIYEKPGEYEAVFVVSCQSLDEKIERVHKVKIIVTDKVEEENPDVQE